jgi:hypothetical protein
LAEDAPSVEGLIDVTVNVARVAEGVGPGSTTTVTMSKPDIGMCRLEMARKKKILS